MTTRQETRGIGDLLSDLGNQVSTLVRKEIQLAKVEVTTAIAKLAQGAVMTAAGALILYAGLLVLLGAIVLGLIEAGLDPWISALIVAVAVLAIGGALTFMGVNRIKETDLAPTETIDSVQKDVEFVKEQVK